MHDELDHLSEYFKPGRLLKLRLLYLLAIMESISCYELALTPETIS